MKTIDNDNWRAPRGAVAVAALLLCSGGSVQAGALTEIFDGFKDGGKASINARARYEYNDVKNGSPDVHGYSLRTRLGYTTGEHEGWRGMLEMEDVSFNNSNDRPPLDVPVTELNQAWLSYRGNKLGRQVYVLDDHRFIGHVGWRQNIQSFDALTGSYLITADTKLNYGYLNRVHRVNATTQSLDGLLANASHKFDDRLALTGFVYLLDFDGPALASSNTFGFRGVGATPLDDLELKYSFSYARQVDNSGSAADFSLDYFAGEMGVGRSGFSAAVGFEILEGDGVSGFTTPLATVHAFNGFADQFAAVSTGAAGGLRQGLKDYYIKFGLPLPGNVPVSLSYHQFRAENVSARLGSEINAVATYKLNDYLTLLSKYAYYDSKNVPGIGYGAVDKTVFTFEVNLVY